MELIEALRILRRRWRVVGIGGVCLVIAAVAATYRVSVIPPGLDARESRSWVASAEVLVDTPGSLLAGARTVGSETIANRAEALAVQLASGPARERIAAGAKVGRTGFDVVSDGLAVPASPSPLARAASEAAQPGLQQVITVGLADPSLSVVWIEARAGDGATAARLAEATVATLGWLAEPAPTGARGVHVEPLGPVQTKLFVEGPDRREAGLAAAIAFVCWCGAVVIFGASADRRRAAPAATMGRPA